jgi:hypothetical protein
MSIPGVEASESELSERLNAIVCATPPLMRVLTVARYLCLPDWLVFSGAVYQPVLNHLTGRPLDYGIKDYDLGYFDASNLSYEAEDAVIRRVRAAFDEPLRSMVEVRNQARVHLWFEAKFGEPYVPLSCTAEALERFASATFAVGSGWNLTTGSTSRLRLVLPICLRCVWCPILIEERSVSIGPVRVCDAAGLKSSLRTSYRSGTRDGASKSLPAALWWLLGRHLDSGQGSGRAKA